MIAAVFVVLFAIFPLTDTDIWWHLACAREWVTTWTPVRSPVVNVHEYFQLVVGFVYGLGGASLLVAFKAVLWGVVFALFLKRHSESHSELVSESAFPFKITASIFLLFIFRYHFEIRPVLFSLLFLGIYWNVLPKLFAACHSGTERQCGGGIHTLPVRIFTAISLLAVQWFWCKCQGLYILGPIFATLVLCTGLLELKKQKQLRLKSVLPQASFVLIFWLMPFLHREGLALFLYPFGLLDRLLGLTPSAAIFASQIAENRSPITLLMAGENVFQSSLMVLMCGAEIAVGVWKTKVILERPQGAIESITLVVAALLALIAERNFVLYLPLFLGVFFRFFVFAYASLRMTPSCKFRIVPLVFIAFILGLWGRSLSKYDYSMVAYQRVPVDAAIWMTKHPHSGRLFNDDRAGGYLAFMNPADSIYIDGRFILKTADFFERYLEYANAPARFLQDADSQGIDRALFPLQYYARWDNLMLALDKVSHWHLVYRDEYFAVFDKE